jgi:hypothetical protein
MSFSGHIFPSVLDNANNQLQMMEVRSSMDTQNHTKEIYAWLYQKEQEASVLAWSLIPRLAQAAACR